MANHDHTIASLVGSEIRQVNDKRRQHSLPPQGPIEYRISNKELLIPAGDFNDANGSFTHVASSRTNDYIFKERSFTVAAANNGNLFDVEGLDKDNTGLGAMRHRGL